MECSLLLHHEAHNLKVNGIVAQNEKRLRISAFHVDIFIGTQLLALYSNKNIK